MILADAAVTVIQVDSTALVSSAATIAGGIITGFTVIGRMWFAYQRERDQEDRKEKTDIMEKMDSWQTRALAREEIIRSDNKANSQALLEVARETVKVEQNLINKIDTWDKNHINKGAKQ